MQDNNTPPNPAAPAAPSSPSPAPTDCAAPAAPDAVPSASAPPSAPAAFTPAVPTAAPASPPDADPAAPLPSPAAQAVEVAAPRRSHRASGEPRQVQVKLDENEIPISIALLGEATKPQLNALHFPGSPLRRIERRLKPLLEQELIERRSRYDFDKKQGIPIPAPHAYRLSTRGHELISNDVRYPIQTGTDEYRVRLPNPTTTLVAEHDLMGSEAIVWLVVFARGNGMSGMFLRREQQLDPQSRAPRIDVVLVVHFGGPQLADGAFVWTKNPPTDEEQSLPLALEIDRNTEAISIIRGKAIRYQEALERQRTQDYWDDHYGRTPIIFWIAPTERRLQAIHRVWQEEWPSGSWALATIDDLSHGRCLLHHDGTMAEIRLFNAAPPALGRIKRSWPARYGFDPPALPPPPPALPPPPPALPPPETDEVESNIRKPWTSLWPPPPRRIRIWVVAPAGSRPSVGVPVGNLAVIVRSSENPELIWEGRLWHPSAALSRLDLGPAFVHEPLTIIFPSLNDSSIIIPWDVNSVSLEMEWPVVPPDIGSASTDGSYQPPEMDEDDAPWWRRALRAHEEWAIHLLWLAPLALAALSCAGAALVATVIVDVQAGLAWMVHALTPMAIAIDTATQPVGGPGVAVPSVATIGLLAALAWNERARIRRFIESETFVDINREVIITVSLFVSTMIFILVVFVWQVIKR